MAFEVSPGKPTTRRYSPAEQAVRLVRTLRAELGTDQGTVHRVARQLVYGTESVRSWVRQADIDEGRAPGVSTGDATRMAELEQENRELKRATKILRRAASFFRGGARPPTQELVAFIDANRADFGVEPVITTLARAEVTIAPSSYDAAKSRPPSARQQWDERLIPQLTALWRENYRVCGGRKLWKAARRAGQDIGAIRSPG